VLGDSGDTVSISDFIKVSGITRTEGDVTYDVYTHGYASTDTKAALWVRSSAASPLITKPPVELFAAAIALRLIALPSAFTDTKAALWVQQGVSMKDMHRGFVINGKVAGDQSGHWHLD
jgi:hypothetical protein